MIKGDKFILGGREFNSRLLIGTGKFSSDDIMKKSIEASKTEIVTVAMRRIDLSSVKPDIISVISREKYLFLPNTSGAADATEAVRIARLCRASGLSDWIKLEITPDPKYLLPDPVETLKAAEILIKDGFHVLPYINADPILAKHLEECGTDAVMPLGSPIGSNKGIRTIELIKIIIEEANIPVIIDAGLGKPSDAALSMELGASAVLVNTAIAVSKYPAKMAKAFSLAVEAGRQGYLAGLASENRYADASSPLTGFLGK